MRAASGLIRGRRGVNRIREGTCLGRVRSACGWRGSKDEWGRIGDGVGSESAKAARQPGVSSLKDIGPGPSSDGKEKAETGAGHVGDGDISDGDLSARGARGVRASSKRTVDNADFKEGGEGKPKSKKKKVRRTGQSPAPSRCGPGLMSFGRPHRRDR